MQHSIIQHNIFNSNSRVKTQRNSIAVKTNDFTMTPATKKLIVHYKSMTHIAAYRRWHLIVRKQHAKQKRIPVFRGPFGSTGCRSLDVNSAPLTLFAQPLPYPVSDLKTQRTHNSKKNM